MQQLGYETLSYEKLIHHENKAMKHSINQMHITFILFCLSLFSTSITTAAHYEANIERREVVTPGIDTENFEISTYATLLSVQNFSTEPQFGLRLAFHLHDTFFLEGSISQADIGASELESNNGTFAFLDRRYTDYHLSSGWHFLQGYSSFGRKRIIHNTYLIGGAGITNFANQNNFTVNFGLGHRLLLNDNLGIRLEGRNYLVQYDNPPIGSTTKQNNLALSLGLSLFF